MTVLPVQFTFSAEPDTIHPGESATLTWASEGVASLSIDGGVGDVSALLPNGSVTVSPAATTTYTATATDRSGATLIERVVVSVASPPPPQHPIRHIVFMLQENRTFDNYFAALGAYRASKLAGASPRDVDGVDPSTTLQTKTGKSVRPYHYQTVCTEGFTFAWNESHPYMDLQSTATFMDNDLTNAKWPLARLPYLLETSRPRIFAVGDVRGGNVKRVASAVITSPGGGFCEASLTARAR